MISFVMLATQLAALLKYMLLDVSCPARAGGMTEHHRERVDYGRPKAYSGLVTDKPNISDWVLAIFDARTLAQAFKAELESLPPDVGQSQGWMMLTREGQLGPVCLSDWLRIWGYEAAGLPEPTAPPAMWRRTVLWETGLPRERPRIWSLFAARPAGRQEPCPDRSCRGRRCPLQCPRSWSRGRWCHRH